jgi:hypothetical protein
MLLLQRQGCCLTLGLRCALSLLQELYLIGGQYRTYDPCKDRTTRRMDLMEILHLPSNSMRTVHLDQGAQRIHAAGAVLSRNIYICGGAGEEVIRTFWEKSCLSYNIDTGTYFPVRLPALQTGRRV